MTNSNLGYATRTEAVLALQNEGKRNKEIARLLGVETKSVSALAASARRKKREASHPELAAISNVSIGKMLPVDVRQTLRQHAIKRDLPLDRLVFDILTATAQRNMVDFVLNGFVRNP